MKKCMGTGSVGKGREMKVFVTGVSGQLGYDVTKELLRRGCAVTGSDIRENESQSISSEDTEGSYSFISLDITKEEAVRQTLVQCAPDVVIHCAAWTAVDLAEEEENRDKVYAVNAKGTEYLAKACKSIDCKMIYISTDYVFHGEGEEPWTPDCEPCRPVNVYGQTKLDGELAVKRLLSKYFIVRITGAFGNNGVNFVKTMLQLGKKHETLRVVCDQVGTPTYTPDLARLLADMSETEQYGCYHATNEGGYISWYEFACEIFRQAGYHTRVIPVTTKEYGLSKAKRPLNSRLDKHKLVEKGFTPLPEWKDALKRYLGKQEMC